MKTFQNLVKSFLYFLVISSTAQQGINYKVLIKDSGGNIVASQSVDIQFIIYQGPGEASNVYQETHTVNTDANGIAIANIGEGTTGDVFTDIDWGGDDHYLNVQIDTGGGLTNMGTTQFMAVPYAINAQNVTGAAFKSASGLTNNINLIDDFLMGATQLNDDGNVDHDSRMFFDKSKGAFRAGLVESTQWDSGNVGSQSFAIGFNTTASGFASLAAGSNTTASGLYATAFGHGATASGDWSLVFGRDVTASAEHAIAFGRGSEASADNATAMGYNTIASAVGATAMGIDNVASGDSSTAMGLATTASGNYSFSAGYETDAESYGSFTMGRFNVGGGTPGSWIDTDPLVEVGIGTSSGNRANALTVLKNGNVGIGITDPQAKLDIRGGDWNLDAGNPGDLRIGNTTNNFRIGVALGGGGAGVTRLYTNSNALILGANDTPSLILEPDGRMTAPNLSISLIDVGSDRSLATKEYVSSSYSGLVAIDEGNGIGWRLVGRDPANYGNLGNNAVDLSYSNLSSTVYGATGPNSVALGGYTKASGDTSIAIGNNTEASGTYSMAIGVGSQATGTNAIAMGFSSEATENHAIAMGYIAKALGLASLATGEGTIASGYRSTAMGYWTKAEAYNSTAIGRYNVGGGNLTTWIETDPLFEIGNGTAFNVRANALTVLKNGTITAPNFDLGEITDPKALTTKEYVDANSASGLEAINEGNGFGWRLEGLNPDNYGNIGQAAVDLSLSYSPSSTSGATANFSLALGTSTSASAFYATAMGYYTKAESYNSTAIGRFNVGGGNPTTWIATDKLFEVGNGSSDISRANAFTILKNGNIGIGTVVPSTKLQIVGGNVTVDGNVGVGTTTPNAKLQIAGSNGISLQITGANDVSPAGGAGAIVMGNTNGLNLALDDNEIMARNNGVVSTLNLNIEGGTVETGSNLEVGGLVNLNKGIASGTALQVNGSEALWFNGTYFSYGFGGSANYFADNVGIGITAPNVALDVNGSIEYTGSITDVSDRRLKENFKPIDGALKNIQNITGYSYNLKADKNKEREYGVIAQELQTVFPEMVSVIDHKDHLGVSYMQLIPVLLEAIKEQQEIIDNQNNKINALTTELVDNKKENTAQNKNIEQLLKRVEQIAASSNQ